MHRAPFSWLFETNKKIRVFSNALQSLKDAIITIAATACGAQCAPYRLHSFRCAPYRLPRPEAMNFKKEQVLTLRLDETTITALKDIAHKKGLGVSTLVRMWVRERLSGNASA